MTIGWVVALGFIVGALVGLTSVGSGALMTPILLLDFGSVLPRALVVGTATTQGTISKFIGSLQNYLEKALRFNYAFVVAITGVPLAAMGAFFSSALIMWNLFGPLLAVVLMAVALIIIYTTRREKETYVYDFKFADKRIPKMTKRLRIKGAILGVIVGLVAGLTGVSTGSIMVSALILWLGFPQHDAVSIAVFEGGIILLAATVTQLYLGHVALLFTAFLLVGAIPGILIGGHFKFKVSQKALGYSIAVVILFEALRTLSSFFFGNSLIPFAPVLKLIRL